MRAPRQRLVLLVVALVALAAAVGLAAPVSQRGLRDAIEPLGAAGPLAYVGLAAALGAAFVPGPLLAAASGLLFGTLTGFGVSLASATLGAVLAVAAARRAGRPGVEELTDRRVRALEELLRRHPLGAVVVQRLAPAVPDAPCSYLFGLAGIGVAPVALGTLLGAAPRAFSYVALGDAAGTGSGRLAAVALGTLVAGAVLGAALAALAVRRARRG